MKKVILNIKLSIILYLVSTTIAHATHVAGGTMTYRCLGNDRYEITMEFRRDCINGVLDAPFDDPASFGVYNGSGFLDETVGTAGLFQIPLTTNDTLIETLTTFCNVIEGDVCIQRTVYRDTIILPTKPDGYIIAYQRCCRNLKLNNVENPTETGASYWVRITELALQECNNAPVWRTWPDIYICADDTLNFFHNAIDVDGDSLVYELCTPSAGLSEGRGNNIWTTPPNRIVIPSIEWAMGYSRNDMFGGGVPLTINPQTGLMTAAPLPVVAEYLVGVCVKEYRNGELLSEIRRDFEYNVRICGRDPKAAFIPGDSVICNSLTVDFTNETTSNFLAVDSLDFTWFFNWPDSNLVSNEKNPSFTFPTSGLYEVALISDDGACRDTAFTTIGVATEDDPALDFSIDADNCNGVTTLYLEATHSFTEMIAEEDYVWRITANGIVSIIDGKETTFQIGADQNVTIVLEVMGPSGCMSTLTKEQTIMTQPDPSLSFDHLATRCRENTEVAFFGQASGTIQTVDVSSFIWFVESNGRVDTFFGQNPVVDIVQDQVITVTAQVSSFEGCTTTYEETLNIATVPFDPIFNDVIVCPGEDVVVYVNNDPGTTVSVDPFPPNLRIEQGNFILENNQSDVQLQITVDDGDCDSTGVVNITVDANPSFAPLEDIVQCSNNSVQLNPNGISSYVYNWEGPPGVNFDTQSSNPVLSLLSTGTFFVTISTNPSSNCFSFDTVQVTRIENPFINVIPDTSIIYCENTEIELTAGSNGQLTWFDENGQVIGNGTSITVSDISESLLYSIESVTPEGCRTAQEIELQFIEEPIVPLAPDGYSACVGDSIVIELVTDNVIEWYTLDGTLINTGVELIINELDQDSTLRIVARNDLGCESSTEIFIDALDLPEVPDLAVVGICRGAPFTTTLMTGDNVVWYDEDGTVVSNDSTLELDSVNVSTFYRYELTNASNCVDGDTLFIDVFEDVGLTVVSDVTEVIYCRGFTPDVEVTSDIDAIYEWYVDGVLVYTGEKIEDYIPTGNEEVTIIAKDEFGCEESLTIQFQESFAEGDISGDDVICLGEESILNYAADDPGDHEIVWTPDSEIVSNDLSVTVSPEQTTEFTAIYTNADGCRDTSMFLVEVGGFDQAFEATADPSEICFQESTQLDVDGNTDLTYTWTPVIGLDDANIIDPIATPDETTTYTVSIVDALGCSDEASVTVTVIQPMCNESDVFIPNMFTPNDDDLNDTFQVESNFLESMTLVVYNRWGEEVFSSTDQSVGWDGSFESQLLAPDVYGYYFTGVCVNGLTFEKKGNVTLIK